MVRIGGGRGIGPPAGRLSATLRGASHLSTACGGPEARSGPHYGGWFFVVDKPDRKDNWIDTSGSAMFTYALERGIEFGLLDRKEYAPWLPRATARLHTTRGSIATASSTF